MSQDQHAVITGGTGSLGREIMLALQRPGWLLENPSRLELDVSDPTSVSSYFAARSVDLLICAAGITRDAPLARLTPEAWQETWEVNFRGAARCAQAVLPAMRERRCGHIVFISSYSALHPPLGQAAYASAKAALLGLMADLATTHGAANIRINTILPGFLETRMTQNVTAKRRAEILSDHALSRFNTCHEVAAFIRFIHDTLTHTSGQVFQLDSRVKFP